MGFVRKVWGKVTGKTAMEDEMRKQAANVPPPPAATAEVAAPREADRTGDETVSDKANISRKGKKGLKISRTSGVGTGVNV